MDGFLNMRRKSIYLAIFFSLVYSFPFVPLLSIGSSLPFLCCCIPVFFSANVFIIPKTKKRRIEMEKHEILWRFFGHKSLSFNTKTEITSAPTQPHEIFNRIEEAKKKCCEKKHRKFDNERKTQQRLAWIDASSSYDSRQ